ncbi:MAG: hypothetical protein LPK11_05460 [Chromatiaceae bacterium]|nr:hypothetical protein [Chromatiaceae bacterium]
MNVISVPQWLSPLFAFLAFSLHHVVAAQPVEVAVNDLAALTLNYTEVSSANAFTGHELSAQVSAYANSALPVSKVVENAAMLYLQQPGTLVEAGQAVLQLEGSEVHHFLTEYATRKAHFALVKKRYDDNKALFEKKAIAASLWQDISLSYQTALLEFEHLDHFYERISHVRDDHLMITVTSPITGILLAAETDTELFRVIDKQQVRLRGYLTDQKIQPDAFRFGDCQVKLARLETTSQNFSRMWWSTPLLTEAGCSVLWHQQLSVVPIYNQAVYRIPQSSIVRHNSQQHVWMKVTAMLHLVPVTIVAKDGGSFWVHSDALTNNAQVLTQSVSAVYGHYLGLGGE